jgi:hypothetical protein
MLKARGENESRNINHKNEANFKRKEICRYLAIYYFVVNFKIYFLYIFKEFVKKIRII